MFSWAEKKRLIFIIIVFAGLLLFFIASWRIVFYKKASCDDGKKNGEESGVDCGGSCRFFCANEEWKPIVRFARAVQSDDGMWGAVASIENNSDASARNASFVFKLYDEKNILVAERHGETYIPPRKVFAIFEGSMFTGDRVPSRAVFEFTEPVRFERPISESSVAVSGQNFMTMPEGARLEAKLQNRSGKKLPRVILTALLFGRDGNVFAASNTEIINLDNGAVANLYFTWQRPLPEPSRVEILYVAPVSDGII